MADNQSVTQCWHQQRQCQQVHPSFDPYDSQVLPLCRFCLLLRRAWAQRHCASAQTPLARCEDHAYSVGTLCRCRISWRPQRVPDARRGDPTGNRRLSNSEQRREDSQRGGWITSAKSGQEQKSRHTGGRRDSAKQGTQLHAYHGSATLSFGAFTADRMAKAQTEDDAPGEPRYAVSLTEGAIDD